MYRRGTRPQDVLQVDIQRSFAPTPSAAGARSFQAPASDGVISNSLTMQHGAAVGAGAQQSPEPAAAAAPWSGGVAAQEGTASEQGAGQLLSSTELQQLSSLLASSSDVHSTPEVSGHQHHPHAGQHRQLDGKLGAYGAGLINRLMALEDAGVYSLQARQRLNKCLLLYS